MKRLSGALMLLIFQVLAGYGALELVQALGIPQYWWLALICQLSVSIAAYGSIIEACMEMAELIRTGEVYTTLTVTFHDAAENVPVAPESTEGANQP